MHCGFQGSGLSRAVFQALSKPGSFYTRGLESGLLVVPELNLVLMAFNG